MQEFRIIYYFRSDEGRILRFAKIVKFQSTPFNGAHLAINGDSLTVDYVSFVEDGMVELIVKEETFKESETERIIDEYTTEYGWNLLSNSKR